MKISFTFRHMDSTEALKAYTQSKLSKLDKFFHEPLAVEVTFSVERHLHTVDIHLDAGSASYRGRELSEDMYASVDTVVDKLRAQLVSVKGGQRAQRRRSSAPPLPSTELAGTVPEALLATPAAE